MNNENMEESVAPQEGQAEATAPAQEQLDPKVQKEMEGYISGLSKMLHSPDTTTQIVEMLGSAPPEQSVPQTALMVNAQMEEAVRTKGKAPSLDILLGAGVFLTNDLVEIGNAAGVFQIQDEAQVQQILQATLQAYIEKGLADGTVDPVELQTKVEPLMSEEHAAAGMEGAQMTGLPEKPSEMTAMEQYATQREKKGMLAGEKAAAKAQGGK